jgi:hypothetical protein
VFGTWVLGWPFLSAEIADADGTQTILWQGSSSLYYVQLLPAAAAFENRAGAGRLHERAFEDSGRDGVSPGRVCGDAGACSSAGQ